MMTILGLDETIQTVKRRKLSPTSPDLPRLEYRLGLAFFALPPQCSIAANLKI